MKKYILITIGICFLLAAIVFVIPYLQKKDLKDAIASALNTDSSALILNIPPMPARLPGSVLAAHNNSFMIYSAGDQTHEGIIEGESFAIEATLQNFTQAEGGIGSSIILIALDNKKHLEVSLKIVDARVLELPIEILKGLSKNNASVQSALQRDLSPLIVNRSYLGNVEYIIKAKDDLGVDALKQISNMGYKIVEKQSNTFKLMDKLESKKEIGFSISKPIVFAFELMKVNSLNTELSGEAVDISLTPISSQRVSNLNTPSQKNIRRKAKWGLITISSAHYPNNALLNVPQATEGANLVDKLFQRYDPHFIKSLRSTKDTPLTDAMILDWSIDLTMSLLENPVDHLLVYYTGHGLSLPNGELLLLQGNVNKDFAERAAEAFTPQLSVNGDGIMLAQTLHSAIGAAGVPFTLLVDACYPNKEMQEALSRVSMSLGSRDGTDLHYYGNESLITNEMSDISHSIANIAQRFSYRFEDNAIIFSSKPGATSVFRENPMNPYGFMLPPLASRMLRYSQYAPIETGDQSIADIISTNIDTKNGIGEISLGGSITWSNLQPMQTAFEHIYKQ